MRVRTKSPRRIERIWKMRSTLLGLPIWTAVLLAGCQTNGGGDFCLVEKPWRISTVAYEALTTPQKQEFVAHNEFGEKHCGWKP